MPRSNWKGYISFGLVSIPIVLYNSLDPSMKVSFKQINRKTGDTIKYKRVDSETGKEVPWEEIGRGYEYQKDVILPVGDDELKRVAGENSRTIAIEDFVDKKNIDLIYIDKTYYLVPDKKGEKGYFILRSALNSTNKVGIAKVIISTKEYLAMVAIWEDVLVLHLLRFYDEIRDLSGFDIPSDDMKKYKVSGKEIEIAKKLINSMTTKWKPEKYKDEYQEAVKKWVNEKIEHRPESKMKPRARALPKGQKVINFVDLLKKSLEENKGRIKQKKSKHIPSKQTAHKKSATMH